jgi:LPXTG-motif cell wall-anchored protein
MSLALVLALVGRVVFSFVDPTITESSGLVDLGSVMVTMNDSGGDAEVFVVDPATGRTVGRTTYADEVTDVEALAPPGRDAGWVGANGDNTEHRDSVQVYRVTVGRGDRTVAAPAYDLVYPDRPHDAESLVAAPGGRLYVITKGLLGGTAYAAPRRLDPSGPNRLRPVGSVDVWATDAALFPDGRHVLVRGYDTAALYTFPGFRPVGSLDLPRQRQGEGVSIARSGRIRLSSEGRNSPVLQVTLPEAVREVVEPAASPPAATSPDAVPAAGDSGSVVSTASAVGGTLVLVGIGLWLVRRRRRT